MKTKLVIILVVATVALSAFADLIPTTPISQPTVKKVVASLSSEALAEILSKFELEEQPPEGSVLYVTATLKVGVGGKLRLTIVPPVATLTPTPEE